MARTAKALIRSRAKERRSQRRLTTVLRVGLLTNDGRASFCVVKNISPNGVQARVYAPMEEGDRVQLRVGDGSPLDGRIIWKRNQLVGIEFDQKQERGLLLRPNDTSVKIRRRSSPRVQAAACATLRTGGRTFAAELCDISTIGTKLRTRKPIAKGVPALLTLPDLPTIRGYVRWSEGSLSGFMFEAPLPVPIVAHWVNTRKRVGENITMQGQPGPDCVQDL